MLNSRNRTVVRCVSHQCVLWDGRALTDDEKTALSRAHKFAHRTMTSADIPEEASE